MTLTEQSIAEAINPRLNVERRKSTGGPSPAEVSRMIEERTTQNESTRIMQTKRQQKYLDAKAKTEQEIERLLKEI